MNLSLARARASTDAANTSLHEQRKQMSKVRLSNGGKFAHGTAARGHESCRRVWRRQVTEPASLHSMKPRFREMKLPAQGDSGANSGVATLAFRRCHLVHLCSAPRHQGLYLAGRVLRQPRRFSHAEWLALRRCSEACIHCGWPGAVMSSSCTGARPACPSARPQVVEDSWSCRCRGLVLQGWCCQ